MMKNVGVFLGNNKSEILVALGAVLDVFVETHYIKHDRTGLEFIFLTCV